MEDMLGRLLPRIGGIETVERLAALSGSDFTSVMLEVARRLLAPVIKAAAASGARVAHLEEPWLAYFGIGGADWSPFGEALAALRTSGMRRVINRRTPSMLRLFSGGGSASVPACRQAEMRAPGSAPPLQARTILSCQNS